MGRNLPVDLNVARLLNARILLLRHLDRVDDVDVLFALQRVQLVLPIGLCVGLREVHPPSMLVENQKKRGQDCQNRDQN